MKKYNEMIVEFMKVKAEKLNEIEKGLGELYFTKEDEEDIMSWRNFEAEGVWEELKENVIVNRNVGLEGEVCPFCIKNEFDGRFNCDGCTYAERHGECLSGGDNYSYIIRSVASKGVELTEVLSDGFYIGLIESIEERYNENS